METSDLNTHRVNDAAGSISGIQDDENRVFRGTTPLFIKIFFPFVSGPEYRAIIPTLRPAPGIQGFYKLNGNIFWISSTFPTLDIH